jgi:hypothetical protein
MLKTIAEVSPQLIAFILALRLSLSRPQLQHVTQVADALITTEGSKTLSTVATEIRETPVWGGSRFYISRHAIT